jgi:choline kinase
MITTAIVLAAGLGSRMQKALEDVPGAKEFTRNRKLGF